MAEAQQIIITPAGQSRTSYESYRPELFNAQGQARPEAVKAAGATSVSLQLGTDNMVVVRTATSKTFSVGGQTFEVQGTENEIAAKETELRNAYNEAANREQAAKSAGVPVSTMFPNAPSNWQQTTDVGFQRQVEVQGQQQRATELARVAAVPIRTKIGGQEFVGTPAEYELQKRVVELQAKNPNLNVYVKDGQIVAEEKGYLAGAVMPAAKPSLPISKTFLSPAGEQFVENPAGGYYNLKTLQSVSALPRGSVEQTIISGAVGKQREFAYTPMGIIDVGRQQSVAGFPLFSRLETKGTKSVFETPMPVSDLEKINIPAMALTSAIEEARHIDTESFVPKETLAVYQMGHITPEMWAMSAAPFAAAFAPTAFAVGAGLNVAIGTAESVIGGKPITQGAVRQEILAGGLSGAITGGVGSVLQPMTTAGKFYTAFAMGSTYAGTGETMGELFTGTSIENLDTEKIAKTAVIGGLLGVEFQAAGIAAAPIVEKTGLPKLGFAETKVKSVVTGEESKYGYYGLGWEKGGIMEPKFGVATSPEGFQFVRGEPSFEFEGFPTKALTSSLERGVFEKPTYSFLEQYLGGTEGVGAKTREAFETIGRIQTKIYAAHSKLETSVSDESLIKEVSGKNPELGEQTKVILDKLDEKVGTDVFGVKKTQTYGSAVGATQTETIVPDSWARGEIHDIDVYLRKTSEKTGQEAAKLVSYSISEPGRVPTETMMVEAWSPEKGWHKILDIHTADMTLPAGSPEPSPFAGSGFRQLDWSISKETRPYMQFPEFIIRKGAAITSFGEYGYGAEPQRGFKDIPDFLSAAKAAASKLPTDTELTKDISRFEELVPTVFPGAEKLTGTINIGEYAASKAIPSPSVFAPATAGSIAKAAISPAPSTPSKALIPSVSPKPSVMSSYAVSAKPSTSISPAVSSKGYPSISKAISSPSIKPSASVSKSFGTPSVSPSISTSSVSPSLSIPSSIPSIVPSTPPISKSLVSPSPYPKSPSISIKSPSPSPKSPSPSISPSISPSPSPPSPSPFGGSGGFPSPPSFGMPAFQFGLGKKTKGMKFGKLKEKVIIQSSAMRRLLYGEANVMTTKKMLKTYIPYQEKAGALSSFPTAQEFKTYVRQFEKPRKRRKRI